MKPYHQLTCNQLPKIQQQVLDYLSKHYDLNDQSSLETSLWLKLETVELLKKCPSLINWTQSLNLKIKEVAATVVNDMEGAYLHIDEPPVVAKINIPILNTQHVLNQWYRVPESIMKDIKPEHNEFGGLYYPLDKVKIEDCENLATLVLTQPIVFNSSIPHRVYPLYGCQFPRVVLTVMFFNQPLAYLDE